MRWFETHTCCPVCRYDLREPEENENTNVYGNDVYGNDVYGNDV
jgi:hypothetical protein